MKPRTLWAGALLLSLASAAGIASASRSTGPKLQVVYRAQPSGEWQVFLFGVQPCGHGQNMQVIYPHDASTQPLEIECDNRDGRK